MTDISEAYSPLHGVSCHSSPLARRCAPPSHSLLLSLRPSICPLDPTTFFVKMFLVQFLTIQACPALKKLETLRCPALAVASVTSCRELTSLSLECPALSQLDLTGCVRLESWDFTHAGDRGSFSALQVQSIAPMSSPHGAITDVVAEDQEARASSSVSSAVTLCFNVIGGAVQVLLCAMHITVHTQTATRTSSLLACSIGCRVGV